MLMVQQGTQAPPDYPGLMAIRVQPAPLVPLVSRVPRARPVLTVRPVPSVQQVPMVTLAPLVQQVLMGTQAQPEMQVLRVAPAIPGTQVLQGLRVLPSYSTSPLVTTLQGRRRSATAPSLANRLHSPTCSISSLMESGGNPMPMPLRPCLDYAWRWRPSLPTRRAPCCVWGGSRTMTGTGQSAG